MAREWYSRPINAGYTVIDGTTTGSYNGNNPSTYVKTWMEYKETVDQAHNRSTVHVLLYSQVIDGGASTNMAVWTTAYNAGWAGWDDGNKSQYSCSYDFNNKHLNKFVDLTLTIPHNTDGTKTINLQAGFTTKSVSVTGGSASGSVTLTPTPQKSVITSVVGLFFGSPSTVNITRYSPDFREEVRLTAIGTAKTTSTAEANFTFTLPRDYAPYTALPCNLNVEFVCETFNGSTSLGTTTYNATYSVSPNDDNFAPTFATPTVSKINDVVASLGNDTLVAGYSKIDVVAAESDVSLKYNATLVKREVTFQDGKVVSGSQNSHESNIIQTPGTYSFTYAVSDSRGFETVYTDSVNVLSVEAPTLTDIECFRGDEYGMVSATGTYIWAKARYSYPSYNGHNSASAVATVSGVDVALPHNTLTLVKSGALLENSYIVTLTITDLLSSNSYTERILSQSIPLNIKKGGNGIAFGKYSEKTKGIELAWKTWLYDNLIPNYEDGTSNDYAEIDNDDLGLAMYICQYDIGGVTGAGIVWMYNNTIIDQKGFSGITAGMSGNVFQFGNNSNITYRIYKNILGEL